MASISVPTNNDPTPPSRKAWVGAVWGNFVAIIPAMVAVSHILNPLVGAAVSAAISLTGMAAGYFLGKKSGEKQQAKELQTGRKAVREPSFFNSGLAKGLVMSAVLGIGVSLLGLAASPWIMAAMLVASLALPIIGGIMGKREMRKEYTQAEQTVAVEHQKELMMAYEQGRVAQPEVAQAPQPETTKFTQAEIERRAKAQQAQIAPA